MNLSFPDRLSWHYLRIGRNIRRGIALADYDELYLKSPEFKVGGTTGYTR